MHTTTRLVLLLSWDHPSSIDQQRRLATHVSYQKKREQKKIPINVIRFFKTYCRNRRIKLCVCRQHSLPHFFALCIFLTNACSNWGVTFQTVIQSNYSIQINRLHTLLLILSSMNASVDHVRRKWRSTIRKTRSST